MRHRLFLAVLVIAVHADAAAVRRPSNPPTATIPRIVTTANNSSCDISVSPAATLLLPFFEVDVAKPLDAATNTIFTIVNTSRLPQIARVTIWTDYAYP